MTSMKYAMLAAVASTGLLFSAVGAAQTTVVTFDNGGEGWDGNGSIEDTGGNPGANAHFFIENFGIEATIAWANARGWGKMLPGTMIHLPIPGRELQTLELPYYTFGGLGKPGTAP